MNCNSNKVTAPKEVLNLTVYTSANGLSNNGIDDLAIDQQDRIWIGTLYGLNVFDGMNWDTINAGDGLPYEYDKVLHFDKQGNLWIGSYCNGNGLIKYDGQAFRLFTTADGLSDNAIMSIASQSDGTIWVGGCINRACRYDGINWECFEDSSYLNTQVISICVENDSSIWFGTGDGVSHYDGKTWKKYLGPFESKQAPYGGYYRKRIEAVYFDRQNIGWFAFQYGVYMYYGGTFHQIILDDYGLTGISDIAQDLNGDIWFGSYSKGIYRYRKGIWTNFSMEDGLPSTWISSVEIDSKGDIWFGTLKGLVRVTMN